ncbi:winged helix-turn-helix domain-containing protein [Colwellia asteriadis]|uniref:Winged helix-turn-helix domain-containing protein n=1 Tax=Colwellia asteriadis TaxID=517723 RepID=A0ABN1L2B5_9GAMM
MKPNRAFNLSNCYVNPTEFSIQLDQGEKQSLQPKFIDVLCYLAQHHPRIIPREELINNIWGENSVVGDKSLTNAIWHLRKSLAEIDQGNGVIETIRKAGYRLVIEPQWSTNVTTTAHSNITVSDDTLQNDPQLKREAEQETDGLLAKTLQYRINKQTITWVVLAAFIAVVIGYFLGKPSHDPAVVTQVTKHPGSELFPSPSPDGRYVVYSQVSNNQPTNLFMKDTLQPQLPAQQLTFDTAIERHSVWSNDGQYLYFARTAKAGENCKYIQLKVLSRQEKAIANCPNRVGYFYLDISPDDKTLAIHGFNGDAEKSGIYFLDLTKENAPLERFSCKKGCDYKDRDMAFSPDGKHLAISRRFNRYSENIYLINIKTKETQQLTFNEEDIVGITWSDQSKIIYATHKAGVRSGFIIDVDKNTFTELNLPGFSYPKFTKQGRKLFYQQRQEISSIASLSLKADIASSPFPVVLSSFSHHSPDYSPINKRFVYVSNESGFYELWSANTRGEERKQLTFLKKNISLPKWSHDGKSIAFLASSEDNKHENIYIYSLVTQKISVLNSPFDRHNRPSWSLDDNKIIAAVYNNNATDLYSITIADGAVERLTHDNARYGIMNSPTTLLYAKVKRGLWQVDLTDKTTPPVQIIDGKEFTGLYAWDYYNNGVYFNKELKEHHILMFHDTVSGKSRPLVKLPLNSFYRRDIINYVPDEDSLLYTKSSYPQANIKMLENSPLLQ